MKKSNNFPTCDTASEEIIERKKPLKYFLKVNAMFYSLLCTTIHGIFPGFLLCLRFFAKKSLKTNFREDSLIIPPKKKRRRIINVKWEFGL